MTIKKIGKINKISPIDIYEQIKSIVENRGVNQANEIPYNHN